MKETVFWRFSGTYFAWCQCYKRRRVGASSGMYQGYTTVIFHIWPDLLCKVFTSVSSWQVGSSGYPPRWLHAVRRRLWCTAHVLTWLPVDQTIKQTLNHNTKTKGEIVGFSLKKEVVQRWLLTAHPRPSDTARSPQPTGMTTARYTVKEKEG